MNSPLRLAVAQTRPVSGDVSLNTLEHLKLISEAAHQKASLAVFPELSLTGYELGLASTLAFSQKDKRIEPFREAATEAAMTLVVGAPIRVGSRLYIGAFVISPDGSVAVYTKRHLGAFSPSDSANGVVPPPEDTVFHRGELDPTVWIDGDTAAVAICADVGHTSHARAAAQRGARYYLASMFNITAEVDIAESRLKRAAVSNGMTVLMANFTGVSGGLPAGGASAAWSGTCELLVQLDADRVGLGIIEKGSSGWSGRAVRLPLATR